MNSAEELSRIRAKRFFFTNKPLCWATFGRSAILEFVILTIFGTKPNPKKGVEWLRKAARKGDAKAQYNLGRAYLKGEDVRANKRLAKIWLEKAAAQNHRQAARLLQHV